jgi:hypothetical protein
MNLEFPTQVPFPLSPARPNEEDRAGASGFLEAISNFLNHLSERPTTPSLDAADSGLDHDHSNESICGGVPAEFTQEAITAVIRNIALPAKDEYVWDPAQYRWILKVIPI